MTASLSISLRPIFHHQKSFFSSCTFKKTSAYVLKDCKYALRHTECHQETSNFLDTHFKSYRKNFFQQNVLPASETLRNPDGSTIFVQHNYTRRGCFFLVNIHVPSETANRQEICCYRHAYKPKKDQHFLSLDKKESLRDGASKKDYISFKEERIVIIGGNTWTSTRAGNGEQHSLDLDQNTEDTPKTLMDNALILDGFKKNGHLEVRSAEAWELCLSLEHDPFPEMPDFDYLRITNWALFREQFESLKEKLSSVIKDYEKLNQGSAKQFLALRERHEELKGLTEKPESFGAAPSPKRDQLSTIQDKKCGERLLRITNQMETLIEILSKKNKITREMCNSNKNLLDIQRKIKRGMEGASGMSSDSTKREESGDK